MVSLSGPPTTALNSPGLLAAIRRAQVGHTLGFGTGVTHTLAGVLAELSSTSELKRDRVTLSPELEERRSIVLYVRRCH